MAKFETKRLPLERDAVAPDGSDVRVLLKLKGGSMAHFELGPDFAGNHAPDRGGNLVLYGRPG
ncbi:MAG: hypothetical protein M1404_03285 [Acidobacteria bacterium]|nr:hypothetical protein [Acidobacteriota bacterium]